MPKECKIIHVEAPEETATKVIEAGLQNYIKEQAGDPESQRVCFALYSSDEELVGGVIGDQYWDWIYIDMMWISEDWRGSGYGSRLLAQLEDEALNRGIKNIYLNTFSFQAPGFYQKCGYQVFGKLENFPVGQQRFFFTKQLQEYTSTTSLQGETIKDIFQIRVRTHLDQRWSDWFDGFQIEYQDEYSIITGPVHDQSALHGVLAKIRDLGLEILLVKKMDSDANEKQ